MMGRKATLTVANLVVGAVLGLLANKMAAVYFGPENMGRVFYALGLLGFAFFITDMGMGQAHIKRVSEGRDPGDCFATFAWFKVSMTLVFVIGSLGLLGFYTQVLGKPIESTTIPILGIVLVYYAAKSLQEIAQSSFDARVETARSQLAMFTDTLVRVLLTILGALLVGALIHQSVPLPSLVPNNAFFDWIRANPGELLALAHTAGGVAAAAVALTMLWRAHERGRFQWALLRDYASFAFPLFFGSTIGVIAANVDAAALGFFLSEREAGIFAGVRRIPLVLGGIGAGIGTLLFPSFSAMASRGEHATIQETLHRATRYLSMALAPMVAFLIVFAVPIIRLAVADTFVSGAPAMALLGLYVFLMTLAVPHSTLLMGRGHNRVVATLGVLMAASVIVFDVLLIPDDIRSLGILLPGLGVTGAALGTVMSSLVWYFGLRVASQRLAGYRETAPVWKHLLASAVMSALLWMVHTHLMPLEHIWQAVLYVLVGAPIYLVSLLALREWTAADWHYLRESIHPVEMVRYLRQELFHRHR